MYVHMYLPRYLGRYRGNYLGTYRLLFINDAIGIANFFSNRMNDVGDAINDVLANVLYEESSNVLQCDSGYSPLSKIIKPTCIGKLKCCKIPSLQTKETSRHALY
jgi:hypothetical protein